MEIEGSDGSKTFLKPGCSKLEWGRGSGFKPDDRTVSRRHVAFDLSLSDELRAVFKVVGKNPIWVHSNKIGKVSTFKTSESGEMEIGDMFCVSANNPIWFTLKKNELGARKTDGAKRELGLEGEWAETESLRGGFEVKGFDELEPESVDISNIDPVKDFGFVLIGKEFDNYPKKMIRDIKNWNWYLEEAGEESEDDEFEESKRRKKGLRRKRKKGGGNEDEDWTGESEDEKELITKARKVQMSKYSIRSKNRDKLAKDTGRNARSLQKKAAHADADDEDDETLGGFIVDNDEVEEEGEEVEEEEEDEFEEEEDELDD